MVSNVFAGHDEEAQHPTEFGDVGGRDEGSEWVEVFVGEVGASGVDREAKKVANL
jgi:hypothetical protein